MATNDNIFLCKRLKKLREQYGLTMEEMAKRRNLNKSAISRLESGKTSSETLILYAKEYCKEFHFSDAQTEQFLRGNRIVIADTSALLVNTQLIDELCDEYHKVILPKTVLDELDNIKNRGTGALSARAWQIIKSIGDGSKTLLREYHGDNINELNDCKIIEVAKDVSQEFGCEVDIITNDADYGAYLRGVEHVHAIHLREYRATKQHFVNLDRVREIDQFYADSYEDCPVPTRAEANAYFNNGYNDGVTLIISAIRNHSVPLKQRKAKILWLMEHGADINLRDCNRYYFPPLSHAVQSGNYPMFHFLLKECGANPNVGSLNPHGANKIRQKNEGNMPLMIASFHTSGEWQKKPDLEKITRELCADPRISINQQDGNGFTALIKACANGNAKCRDILLAAGADKRIVDLDGKDYNTHWNECLEMGPMKERNRNKGGRQ